MALENMYPASGMASNTPAIASSASPTMNSAFRLVGSSGMMVSPECYTVLCQTAHAEGLCHRPQGSEIGDHVRDLLVRERMTRHFETPVGHAEIRAPGDGGGPQALVADEGEKR